MAAKKGKKPAKKESKKPTKRGQPSGAKKTDNRFGSSRAVKTPGAERAFNPNVRV